MPRFKLFRINLVREAGFYVDRRRNRFARAAAYNDLPSNRTGARVAAQIGGVKAAPIRPSEMTAGRVPPRKIEAARAPAHRLKTMQRETRRKCTRNAHHADSFFRRPRPCKLERQHASGETGRLPCRMFATGRALDGVLLARLRAEHAIKRFETAKAYS